MIAALTPIRERADALKREPAGLVERLRAGAAKARALARVTLAEVRERMGFLKPAES
jgi:tryptophanyl-tRNA synthetase